MNVRRSLPFLLLLACAETRQISPYSDKISVTHDEGVTIDRAEQASSALGHDPHRECLLWRDVRAHASAGSGVAQYAEERAKNRCNERAEQLLAQTTSAIRAAEAGPHDVGKQLAAARTAKDFFETQPRDANATADDVMRAVHPVLQRILVSEASCDERRVVAGVLAKRGRDDEAAKLLAGPLRSCATVDDAVLVVRVDRGERRCDEGVAFVAAVWPRARARNEQIALLDAVASCSDAFTARRNFAFVPRDVLMDYQALLAHREVEQARQELADRRRELVERCESDCLTTYAENGTCMSMCSGSTSCVQTCQKLGESCHRNCR